VDVLTSSDASPSEALLALLSSLDLLPFEAQISFFDALYVSQEERLEQIFPERMYWLPKMPLEHVGVVCDGCGKNPLVGLRFRCKACLDYDLCAECFVKKGSLHGGDCSDHHFDMTVLPSRLHPWMETMGAKGCHGKDVCKATWHCKGKGIGKGKRGTGTIHQSGGITTCGTPRLCARDGCSFAATWHATHCCNACVLAQGKHGPRCERRSMPIGKADDVRSEKYPEEERNETTFPTTGDEEEEPTQKRLEETGSGNESGVELDERKEALTEFEKQLEDTMLSNESGTEVEKQEEALKQARKQLDEMGFGSAEVLLELLKSYGCSVEKVIAALTEEP
jgi:hypothetical protein